MRREWHLNHSALPPKQNDLDDNLDGSVFFVIILNFVKKYDIINSSIFLIW